MTIEQVAPWMLFTIVALFSFSATGRPVSAIDGAGIYLKGVLPSGRALVAHRDNPIRLEGAEAACVNCHRRSGLGGRESRIVIPPVAGPYLFHKKVESVDDLDLPYLETFQPNREPYTDELVARAVRKGIGSNGKKLSYLMPRYDLADADLSALSAYLRTLAPLNMPGVNETFLDFATIITPDADPKKREAFLAVMNEYFKDKNAFYRGAAPRVHSARKMMFRVNRKWQLHVWELTGAAETWEAQLRERLKAEPVLAVISGLGGAQWDPVQRFCESAALPCLFPNVDLPAFGTSNVYTIYFSRGVLLEADLIGQELASRKDGSASNKVVQVYRGNDIGAAAARRLSASLSGKNLVVENHELPAQASAVDLNIGVNAARAGEILVLWLRPDDLRSLGTASPAAVVYASSLMGGLDNPPVPASWLRQLRMAYPFDLPDRRTVPVNFAQGWFRIRKIPVTDLRLQADTFLACGLLAETVKYMVDAFFRDYLIERLEDNIEHRIITGFYRHLSLGPGQRIASKGGFLVRYDASKRAHWVADSDWIVP